MEGSSKKKAKGLNPKQQNLKKNFLKIRIDTFGDNSYFYRVIQNV